MRPILFEFVVMGRDVTVKSYTFFVVLAAIAAIVVGTAIARKRGLDARKTAICLLIGVLATLVAGRLVHWITNPGSFDGLRAVVSLDRSNFSIFAGLLLGVPTAAAVARKLGLDVWRLADSATPAIALAGALGRVGCFLNGCCFGKPVAWGIACPVGGDSYLAQVTSGDIGLFDAPLPVHPTQLYEAAAAIIGGLIALWLLRGKKADGTAFLVFAIWFASFRWVNSYFLWTPPSFTAPHWLYPAIYSAVIAACIVAILRRRNGLRG